MWWELGGELLAITVHVTLRTIKMQENSVRPWAGHGFPTACQMRSRQFYLIFQNKVTSANVQVPKERTNPRTGDIFPNWGLYYRTSCNKKGAHCLPLSNFAPVAPLVIFHFFRVVMHTSMGQSISSETSENPFLLEPLCSGLPWDFNEIKSRDVYNFSASFWNFNEMKRDPETPVLDHFGILMR